MSFIFTSKLQIMDFLNSGKNKTTVTRQRMSYQIPLGCGSYYVGRTIQNLKNI